MKTKIFININNFGPLHDIQLELFPFMLFTGASNMGKSYANYLVYYFMRSIIQDAFPQIVSKKIKEGDSAGSFELSINELISWLNDNVEAFARRFLGDAELFCDVEYDFLWAEDCSRLLNVSYMSQDNPSATPETPFKALNITINDRIYNRYLFLDDRSDLSSTVATCLSSYVQNILWGRTMDKAIILPPARGAFVGENFSMKKAVTSSSGMYEDFLSDYDASLRVVPYFLDIDKDEKSFFVNRVKELLHGDLIAEKGIPYLVLPTQRKLPLTAAASSIKELSPFLFYLQNYWTLDLSFCIEEPEAHLHPTMQIDLADLLAACRNKGMFFHMTTHSDYFVQRVNQLLRVGKLQRENPEAYQIFKSQNKWNRRYYLNDGDVVCYYFGVDDSSQVIVEKFLPEDGALPMKTFYGAMTQLTEFNEMLENYFQN